MTELNHLHALIQKHKKLDLEIKELESSKSTDHLVISKMKKDRLLLKEQIVALKKELAYNAANGEQQ